MITLLKQMYLELTHHSKAGARFSYQSDKKVQALPFCCLPTRLKTHPDINKEENLVSESPRNHNARTPGAPTRSDADVAAHARFCHQCFLNGDNNVCRLFVTVKIDTSPFA
jgi:hypothetical protein